MSFRLVTAVLAARAAAAKDKVAQWFDAARPRVDTGLIHSGTDLDRLRIGAGIDLSGCLARFVLAEGAGALARDPGGWLTCQAYGRIEDGDAIIHRFYLTGAADGAGRILQVTTQGKTLLDGEVKLLQGLADFAPASAEEWGMWLDGDADRPPLLGGITMAWQEGTPDEATFGRVWGCEPDGGGADSIAPRDWVETVRTDPTVGGDTVGLQVMLYGRMLGDIPEWLYLSASRRPADGDPDEAWIEAQVGLTLDARDIKVAGGG